ncbi:MAG: glycoside hydrolase family 97 protein [Chitinophagales bacterium]
MQRKLPFTCFLLFCYVCLSAAEPIEVTSLDSNTVLKVETEGQLSWSVVHKDKTVIEAAKISMTLQKNRSWGINPSLKGKTVSKKEGVIKPVVPNKDAVIEEAYQELRLQFQGDYQIVFRVYNEGVAYHFEGEMRGEIEVYDEQLEIIFPKNTVSFFPKEETMYSHYERTYIHSRLDTLKDSDFCSLPVLVSTENKARILITEAALHDYPALFLEGKEGSNSLKAIFPKYVLETIPNEKSDPDRNVIITKEADYIAKTSGKRAFPWRVFVISEDDRTLIENNLVFQLSRPLALKETDWIRPGKVAWDWYNANNIYGVDFKSGLNTATYKYYIDFASENGIEYVILDEGWTKSTTEILGFNPDMDVAELIRYGKAKNVGIILWVLWKPLNDNMEEILKTYSDWGAVGVKVDFMQRADQYMVSSYEEIARMTAKYKLLVDFHGAFKPAGLRRVYPNLLSYEGVKGSEWNKWSADITPEHNVTIPFIRMAAGPMDYTPGAMRNAQAKNFHISFERPMSQGTRCHQVAMYVVFESPLQMMCEVPSAYRKEQETVDFITQIPTTWDETKVLEAEVGDYVLLARRKGTNWYVAAMTDWTARELEIDWSFLPADTYQLEVMQDGINAERFAEDYKRTSLTIDRQTNTSLKVQLASGGGWVGILKEVK